MPFYTLLMGLSVVGAEAVATMGNSGSWRDPAYRARLENQALTADFQACLLYQLKDRDTGQTLLSVDPEKWPAKWPLFGPMGIDLDACAVSQKATPNLPSLRRGGRGGSTSLVGRFRAPEGTEWELRWSIEPGAGDLILQTSAQAAGPVGQFRVAFPGCNIADHRLVWVDGCGVSHVRRAPWDGALGDVASEGFSPRFVHPLVVLFQGEESGWFLEGRDPDIGPANVMVGGRGQTADVVMARGYPLPTRTPQLFEVHLRTYHGAWQDAVDPYVDWLERGVGLVPLDRKPQIWVQNIRSQAYVEAGDFEGLEALAKRLDPAKTLLGRVAGFRPYAFDTHFPDYTPGEAAARWFQRARELGFHVGVHINTTGVDPCYPELIERFRKGFMEIQVDADGNETYTDPPPSHAGRITIETKDGKKTYWGVPPTIVYSTTANKDWRDHLIERLRPAVEAGVDMIYLDESMGLCGKFMMDGTTGIQGVMALEKEILAAYPHVVLETEQINPMNARWSSFALTTLDLGHPLGGYIFSRFVKIVPEGVFYQPTDNAIMDQFQSFGFLLPGANGEETWLQIAQAFQDFDLAPASRLPRQPYQQSGWQGPNGVTAFYEKHPNRRGLVVYVLGQEPRWFGSRITGVKTWPGPGALRDWALYDGNTLLGLDPQQTYVFDETVTLPPDRFHITKVPDDFALYTNMNRRIRAQDLGKGGSFYKVTCTGHGEIGMVVPDDCLVFLDGEEVPVDRLTRTARARIAAESDQPSVLLAYPQSDTLLMGKWVELPWQTPPQEHYGFVVPEGDGFFNHLCGTAQIIGRLPPPSPPNSGGGEGGRIRLQGSWGMSGQPKSLGDGVVRINGREVLRIPPGDPPVQVHPFDADLTAFAGQHILLEFAVDGEVHGFSPANWYRPEIVVTRNLVGIGRPTAENGWDTTNAVHVRASSQHATYVAANAINGSGLTADGLKHGNTGLFISGPLADSQANPRGGTVTGGHWIEFTFDRVYNLEEMWLWNYNGNAETYNYKVQGFQSVTIQSSPTGRMAPGDWTTIFTGQIPMSDSSAPTNFEAGVSLKIDCGGVSARYVVITTATAPEHNWSEGQYSDAGLSEVRFLVKP